jgi:uncharacterized protein (DUF2147 family)
MRRFFLALTVLLISLAPASANARSNLEGRWKKGNMEIVIAPCGRALCGTVVKASANQQAKAARGSATNLIGARLIDNIQPTGADTYRADVFVADRDANAHGTIRQVGPNRLNVRGCVWMVICRTTSWERVSR